MVYARQEGREVDPERYRAAVVAATHDIVKRQLGLGIDIVSDGEMSKPGFVNYIGQRLTGFGGVGEPWSLADMDNLPELVNALYGGPGGTHIRMPRCEGEVRYTGHELVQEDIA